AKDPIRFAGGATSLYSYALLDPTNTADPTGKRYEPPRPKLPLAPDQCVGQWPPTDKKLQKCYTQVVVDNADCRKVQGLVDAFLRACGVSQRVDLQCDEATKRLEENCFRCGCQAC
nr:hypothetical protein [Polyangiaceae bacterium]